jgi:hypothetical protein
VELRTCTLIGQTFIYGDRAYDIAAAGIEYVCIITIIIQETEQVLVLLVLWGEKGRKLILHS